MVNAAPTFEDWDQTSASITPDARKFVSDLKGSHAVVDHRRDDRYVEKLDSNPEARKDVMVKFPARASPCVRLVPRRAAREQSGERALLGEAIIFKAAYRLDFLHVHPILVLVLLCLLHHVGLRQATLLDGDGDLVRLAGGHVLCGMPLASMPKVTSNCGTTQGASRMLSMRSTPKRLETMINARSPSKTWIKTPGWLSAWGVKVWPCKSGGCRVPLDELRHN
eukprot:CAMPEP_0117541454 /NCGR_PEP_ID=MMETSP0784-20121206/44028_1 /TAXON_ID=39447 /ORGANISM="" /LENGTH=222 /DNA_ID=CAMNT_0005338151 /DNA_START=326 /DNA_END=990 /DNA_ORIENTATION=+